MRRIVFRSAVLGWAIAIVMSVPVFGQQEERAARIGHFIRFGHWLNERPQLTAPNPDPDHLPTIGCQQADHRRYDTKRTIVTIEFPELPGQICDAWCYEGQHVDLLSVKPLEGGRLELRHRFGSPPVTLITTVTPEPQAVEFVARMEFDENTVAPPSNGLRKPELCFQFLRAAQFGSSGQPYSRFVARSFILTREGITHLDKTQRFRNPAKPDNHPESNPPAAQHYLPEGIPQPEWTRSRYFNFSPNRFSFPLIGTVSRDGRHMIALASAGADRMTQAVRDCLHNIPSWLPETAPIEERTWRVKVYLAEDVQDLLKRVAKDFPATYPATQATGDSPQQDRVMKNPAAQPSQNGQGGPSRPRPQPSGEQGDAGGPDWKPAHAQLTEEPHTEDLQMEGKLIRLAAGPFTCFPPDCSSMARSL